VIERAVILSRGGTLQFQLQEPAVNLSTQIIPVPATQKQWLESQRANIKAALKQSHGILPEGGMALQLRQAYYENVLPEQYSLDLRNKDKGLLYRGNSNEHRGDLPICAILYVKKSPAERRAGQREDCGIAFSGQLWGCVVSAGDHDFCR
jgi:hypothetical protein